MTYSPDWLASMGAILTAAAQRVGEPSRDPRRVALLPQRDHNQLAAGLVVAADVHDVAVVEVADQERRPLAWRDPPGSPRPADAPGDLRSRIEPPGDALAEALDGVVGHGYERRAHSSKSRCSSPTTGESRSDATRRTASSTPGMNDVRSVESWRIVSVCPTSPRMTSWCATSPGSRTEWISTSPDIISAVRAAVPDGASSLPSWCSSTISARAITREASAAKRIISTAPMAKLGAKNTFAPRRSRA